MQNRYTPYEIARMIDISAVRADSTFAEVCRVAKAAPSASAPCWICWKSG